MDVFYDRLKLGSTAVLDCHTGQNKQVLQKRALIAIHRVGLDKNPCNFTPAQLIVVKL